MAQSSFYHVRQVMEEIRSGNAFDISWVTADKKRKTGGRLMKLRNAVRADVADDKLIVKKGDKPALIPAAFKSPNHFENDTINIRKRGTQGIVKVHVTLITSFNNKPFIL